jgi:hypothetical protein
MCVHAYEHALVHSSFMLLINHGMSATAILQHKKEEALFGHL